MFLVVASIVWVLLLPRAARTVQAVGDGCEMAMAAVRGTLVHPPGFPLYTALNDLIVAGTSGDPYGVLALSSALFTGAAAGALALVFMRLGLGALVAGAGALAFGLLPAALWSGVHVEVFPLHHLLAALLLGATFAAAEPGAPRSRLVLLGLLCGVGGAHQPIIVLWAPLVVFAGLAHLRQIDGTRARLRAAGASLLALVVGLVPYGTLPLREQHAPELAFGSVDSWTSLIAHALRVGYGTLRFARDLPEQAHAPVGLFFDELARAAPLAVVALPIAGIVVAIRRDGLLSAALATALLHLVFASRLVIIEGTIAEETARRFLPSVALALVVLLAVLLRTVRFRGRGPTALLVVGLLGPSVVALPTALPAADAARDDAATAYLRAVFDALPEHAVFFADADLDAFCVLYEQHALGRRPDVLTLATGRLGSRWYRDDLALTPLGAGLSFDERADRAAWARAAIATGRRVFSTLGMAAPAGFIARPVGVVAELFPTGQPPADRELVERNLARCAHWPDVVVDDRSGRRSSDHIRRAFLASARAAARAGRAAAPEAAAALARAVTLVEGGDSAAARRVCAAASSGGR